MKKQLLKNKKAQVFLMLAIVILIYLILLSTTVYRITQSPYVDPAPNQKQLSNYVDNSIYAMHDLTEAALSQYSQGIARIDIVSFMQAGLTEIEEYLDNHNLPANLSLDLGGLSVYNSSTSADPVLIHIECNISIHIDSPDFYYDATFLFETTYYMEISDTSGSNNYIYIYKDNNGIITTINDATITITPFTAVSNLGDGSYLADLQLGQEIEAVLPHNIYLWLEI
jgi:hypothetical protein